MNFNLHHILNYKFLSYITQEDKGRAEIFKEYARKKKESVWAPFLNMLNRQDGFITNMTSRILAKMACWSRDLMDGSGYSLFYFCIYSALILA